MPTITKKDFVDRIAERSGVAQSTAKTIIQDFLDEIVSEVAKGNRLEFRDFGVFEIRDRAPRVAQNPKTLERVPVPAKRTVKFKVGRLMKVALEQNARVEVARRKDGVVKRPARVPVASYAQDS